MRNIAKLYHYIADERRRLIGTVIVSTLLSGAGIATPLFFKYVIDNLTAVAHGDADIGANGAKIAIALGGLAALYVVSNIFSFMQERLTDRLAADIQATLEQRIFGHLMQLSIDYYERTRVGEIMAKTQTALMQFTFWLRNLSEGTLTRIIQLILTVGLLTYVNLWVGLVVTVMTTLSIAIQVVRIKRSRQVRVRVHEYDEQINGYASETISNIATVRSSLPSKARVEVHGELIEKHRGATYEMNNIQQFGNLGRGLVNDLGSLIAICIITWQIFHHNASAGDLVAVALYLQQITSSSGQLGRFLINTSEVETAVGRIIDLLETKPTVVDKPASKILTEIKAIEFKHVSFTYPGTSTAVLEDISFSLKQGQTLALVGPSGAGKSTITKLLLRFYEPTTGEVFINGRPIEDFTQESIRQHIGMVMQDVALFNDSVLSNLMLAAPGATSDQVETAAKQAHAHEFIANLPDAYNTLVGERGVKLSGGEKQRVAIARAILKDPDLIILDEATSALDSQSEVQVQAGLKELMEKRTGVVIAHRLSTVMEADQILVLQDGKVIERGTHKQLADTKGGLYADLLKLQRGGVLA